MTARSVVLALMGAVCGAAVAAPQTAQPPPRVSQSPDCLVVEHVHSQKGRVSTVGVLDTRLHLYVYVPSGTRRFVLGVYDQRDDVPAGKLSSFVLYSPDGSESRTLDKPVPNAWAEYPVATDGKAGIWRLTVTGPEDRLGADNRPLSNAPRARNAFMVRTVGDVDLYLKPEPAARVRGLRFGSPRFGGSATHRFTVQVPAADGFRVNLLYPKTLTAQAIRITPPGGTAAPSRETRTSLVRDDRLSKDLAFTALDAGGGAASGGLWSLGFDNLTGTNNYGFGIDGEYRVFFGDAPPLMPMPVATPIQTGDAAARIDVASPQAGNERTVLYTDRSGRGMLYLLPGFAYRARATRGLEFGAAEATLTPGSRATADPARLVERMPDWYVGDTHLHTTYYDGSYTPRQMIEAARAAGLDWVFTTEHAHSPITERTEQVIAETASLTEPGKFLVLPGMEYTSGTFHANVLGGIVQVPAASPLAQIVKAVREKDTAAQPMTIALNHPTNGETAEAIARTIDDLPMMELWNSDEPDTTRLWWDLLNKGLRVAAQTGSDSHDRKNAEPGYRRTYVYLGDAPLTGANVVRALREGRSFLSMGALLDFTMDGKRPGETMSVAAKVAQAKVSVRSARPIGRIDIVHNGKTVHTLGGNGKREFTGTVTLPSLASGWYLAQVWGTDEKEDTPLAMCNPVYVGPGK